MTNIEETCIIVFETTFKGNESIKGVQMNKYLIVTDSSCDLPVDLAKELGVKILKLEFIVEGEEARQNDEIDEKQFYEILRSGKMITTSAVAMDKFISEVEPFVAEGFDVLYLGFSSGLSSTYSAGFVGAQELFEKYPDRKIYTVDTLAASMGQGLLVWYAANMQKEGKSIEEVRDFIEDNKMKLAHWFTVSDLFFLKRGGRISAATALVGTMLSIKPVMHVDDEGKLIKVATARGRKNSIDALFAKVKETAIDPANQTMFISHGDCIEDAEYLANKLKDELSVKEVIISYVGPVIGAHSGPGTLAMFFIGTNR